MMGEPHAPDGRFEETSPAGTAFFAAPDSGATGAKYHQSYHQSWLKVGAEVNEVVPITWEN